MKSRSFEHFLHKKIPFFLSLSLRFPFELFWLIIIHEFNLLEHAMNPLYSEYVYFLLFFPQNPLASKLILSFIFAR